MDESAELVHLIAQVKAQARLAFTRGLMSAQWITSGLRSRTDRAEANRKWMLMDAE
jgi:hypothetical protein